MAQRNGKPELEDGFTRIANELLEAIAQTSLTDYESRCVHFLWRKTYGWQNASGESKKSDIISHGQWAKGTAMNRSHVHRTLGRLVQRNIFRKDIRMRYGKRVIMWGFQKYYRNWIGTFFENLQELQAKLPPSEVAIQASVATLGSTDTSLGDGVSPGEVSKVTPSEVYTKDNKDTIQKIYYPGEPEFLQILKRLKGWKFDLHEDLNWLREFQVDFPDTTVEHIKSCRDHYSGAKIPQNKGPWKNRFRNWMKYDALYKKPTTQLYSVGRRRPGSIPTTEELREQAKKKGVTL